MYFPLLENGFVLKVVKLFILSTSVKEVLIFIYGSDKLDFEHGGGW